MTFTASRDVFVLVSGDPVLDATTLDERHLLAIAAAGLVYFISHHVLLALVLTPLALAAYRFSPWLLPLMMAPGLGMHRSARPAALREYETLRDALAGLPKHHSFDEAHESVAAGELEAWMDGRIVAPAPSAIDGYVMDDGPETAVLRPV